MGIICGIYHGSNIVFSCCIFWQSIGVTEKKYLSKNSNMKYVKSIVPAFRANTSERHCLSSSGFGILHVTEP